MYEGGRGAHRSIDRSERAQKKARDSIDRSIDRSINHGNPTKQLTYIQTMRNEARAHGPVVEARVRDAALRRLLQLAQHVVQHHLLHGGGGEGEGKAARVVGVSCRVVWGGILQGLVG